MFFSCRFLLIFIHFLLLTLFRSHSSFSVSTYPILFQYIFFLCVFPRFCPSTFCSSSSFRFPLFLFRFNFHFPVFYFSPVLYVMCFCAINQHQSPKRTDGQPLPPELYQNTLMLMLWRHEISQGEQMRFDGLKGIQHKILCSILFSFRTQAFDGVLFWPLKHTRNFTFIPSDSSVNVD
jgi:hypothetical protein